jgi:RimJ/RimL family protein N-acetyltransferase
VSEAVSTGEPVAVAAPAVRLVPFTRSDFARLASWTDSPEALMQWAGPVFRWPLDASQLENYLAPTFFDPPPRLIWRAEADDGAIVGHVELDSIDRANRSASLCRVQIAPAHRGRGLSRAMVAGALAVAFDELGLHRVDLNVFTFNAAALRCYEGLGFVREGVARDARRMGDGYWSLLRCSLLEDEWRRSPSRKESHGLGM